MNGEYGRRLRRFLGELRRRNVYRVGIAYAVVAFVVWQAANLLFPALDFPAWTVDFVIILTLLGFPVALVVAWAFELTPEGVRRTRDGHGRQDGVDTAGRRAFLIGLGALVLVLGGFLVWQGTGDAGGDGPTASASPEDSATLPRAMMGPGSADARSVAVLPFDNLSPDSANAYFAYGVHDAVITALANLGDLTVTSRTSVMQYDESAQDVRTIAAELGVTHIVEGTVQRAGERVRATIQLIDARTDRHLWADHFEREVSPEALFDIQSQIAEEVARALQANLTPGEREQIARRPTDDLEAWELFTRARHIGRTSEYSPELAARVFGMVRRATELDPEFALAHAELADMYENVWNRTEATRWRDSIRAAAERALAIDPSLPEGQLAMAEYHQAVGDLEAEREATLRALELRPNYAEALAKLSRLEASSTRLDRAVCVARRAVAVDPTDPAARIRLGHAYRDLGLYSRAERSYTEALNLRPDYEGLYGNLANMALAQGDRRRALEHYRARRAVGDSTGEHFEDLAVIEWRLGWLDSARVHFRRAAELGSEIRWNQLRWGIVLWEAGSRDSAEAMLDAFESRMRSQVESGIREFFPELGLFGVNVIRGDSDAAVRWLDELLVEGFRILPMIQGHGGPLGPLPGLERLREDERYRRIEARLAAVQDSMQEMVERSGC